MARTCFVIMPFSATPSCTEDEWTAVFQKVLKPAIEGADLGYICRRSVASRGNVVGTILQDLNEAHLVLADLTDRNANVFYELGVRHALKDRTVLIAQKKEDIPFDLQAYAYHIYDWKTNEGIKALAEKIKSLLLELDGNSERPDNPVSDFLRVHLPVVVQQMDETITPTEVAIAQSLVGEGAIGIDVEKVVRGIVHRGRPNETKTILRLTKSVLVPLMIQTLTALNARKVPETVTTARILENARPYLSEVEPLTQNIEVFGLTSIVEGLNEGLDVVLKLAGNLVSISERPVAGQTIKFAQGAPALMAWRILCLCGAKALDEEDLSIFGRVLKEPIEVEESTGKFSHRPLMARRELFYPDAFLGYADQPMSYMDGLWNETPHLKKFFGTNEDYQLALAAFFIVAVLASPFEDAHPLYPGYRLLRQASKAMSYVTSKLFYSKRFQKELADTMGISSDDLVNKWSERVSVINSVRTDNWHEVKFPEEFGIISD